MTEKVAQIFGTGHITSNVSSQRIMDESTTKDIRLRANGLLKSEDEFRKASEVLPPWLKSGDEGLTPRNHAPPTPKLPPGEGRLVQLAEQRRRNADIELGAKWDMPKPQIKLRGRTPKTPNPEDSIAWGQKGRDLERRALARVLQNLQERLGKEKMWRQAAEEKLGKRRSRSETPLLPGATRTLSSSAFDEIDGNTKAMAISASRGMGWYEPDAAGARQTDRMTEMLERQAPYQRPKRNRPLSSDGAPYGTMVTT
mmetsp:Transcript_88373/g.156691  ORF Transcript_88373/g.156691 Transcript_88373/m.156691 type:complete len:255 (-) Transcript_88373:106-870(-)